jgi:class 3 adenylate cyclase
MRSTHRVEHYWAIDGAFAPAALAAARHPSRTTALVALEAYADPLAQSAGGISLEEGTVAFVAMRGTGESQHAVNPDMPWNDEIRAAWARLERLTSSPNTVALMQPLLAELNVRAVLPTIRVPTLVLQHTDDQYIPPAQGKFVADHIPGAKYVEHPERNMYHFVEPWRDSFQEIAEFLTGHQAEVADDRVLSTVLFTDIVDSTRRAAEIGDRDWHALLDAHDAVVRSQLVRFRGREVNRSGDGFLAMFDGPQRAIRCAMAIRDAVQALGIEVRAGLHTGECEVRGDDIGGIAVHIGARVSALAGPDDVLVSSTLRDLVIGSGLEFDDRGTYELKGVPGEWSTSACADGARATAAAVIAATTQSLPNLIVVLWDSSHPAQAAEWWPLPRDRERGSQQPAARRRGCGRVVATRTSARAVWRSRA